MINKVTHIIRTNPKSTAVAFVLFVALSSALIWSFVNRTGEVSSPALDSFEKLLDETIEINSGDLKHWYVANITIQTILIVTGLAATISAAATTKENANDIKAFTVVLTAVTSTLAIVLTTFHVRENIETFIRANADLETLEMDYFTKRVELEPELRKRAIDIARKRETAAGAATPPSSQLEELDPPELLAVQATFQRRYLEIEAARLHAWASVGQQSLSAPPVAQSTEGSRDAPSSASSPAASAPASKGTTP